MDHILITLNGYGELLRRRYENKPLYEFARKDHLDRLAERGLWGRVLLGNSLEKAYFTLCGFQESLFPGESYLRCLEYGLAVEKHQTLFLGSFVTQDRGQVMETDIHLSPQETSSLLEDLCEVRGRPFFFRTGASQAVVGFDKTVPDTPLPGPFNLRGHRYDRFLPRMKEFTPVADVITSSPAILERNPVNTIRADLGENVANLLWLWGMGRKKDGCSIEKHTGLPVSFHSRSGKLTGLAGFLNCTLLERLSFSPEDNRFWWIQSSLPPEENPSLWVRTLERLDREILGLVQETFAERGYRLLLIFDGFTREDREMNNPWAVFLFCQEGPDRQSPLPARTYRRGGDLLKAFVCG